MVSPPLGNELHSNHLFVRPVFVSQNIFFPIKNSLITSTVPKFTNKAYLAYRICSLNCKYY